MLLLSNSFKFLLSFIPLHYSLRIKLSQGERNNKWSWCIVTFSFLHIPLLRNILQGSGECQCIKKSNILPKATIYEVEENLKAHTATKIFPLITTHSYICMAENIRWGEKMCVNREEKAADLEKHKNDHTRAEKRMCICTYININQN